MAEPAPYCDVALPLPLDRLFTYRLPLTLQHRVQAGCRILVPFGSRKLVGVVVATHDQPPDGRPREALQLLDEEPAFTPDLMELARWIAHYYVAPLGEVFRTMAPLASEVRQSRTYALTPAGREVARRLTGAASEGAAGQILRLLDERPLSEATLARKVPGASEVLQGLLRRGWVSEEERTEMRDLLRAPAARLRVELVARASQEKLSKAEREVLAYLELHPGSHNLADLESRVRGASTAARKLARRGLVRLFPEAPQVSWASPRPRHVLNPFQQRAWEAITAALDRRQFHAFLLFGVTGSGKTEVYLHAIEAALARGRGALLLVPEIALTPAVAGQFAQRFGYQIAILHSGFTARERAAQWRRIRHGEARVVVATRSGVFAPVQDLGLIIVDEEHDHSYKQDETPRYHGRDVAVMRAQMLGAVVVLGSATPSIESRYNVERGRYTLLELPERVEQRPLPTVHVIDMRQEFLETRRQELFSRRLLEAIRQRLERHEQVVLLMNRRGFSSFATCRSCGERIQCRNCAVTLTYHRAERRMLCHYCNYAEPVPERCPACGSEYIYFVGYGSERVEEELRRVFPQARIARMDRDTVTGKRQYELILQGFSEHAYDILVGTQMIAKGHDVPGVTLVGVVSADIGLGLPDFRAAERTFQLLTQAAGRAGRGEIPGEVLIQTLSPDHYAIRCAAAQDYPRFYEQELRFRRLMRYPPFTALAKILIRSRKQDEAWHISQRLAAHFQQLPPEIKLLGPSEAPVPKLKSEYRYQMLLKSTSRRLLNQLLHEARRYAGEQQWPPTAVVIDVDPVTLL